jgi:predicted nucleotidyltransferase
MGTKEDVMDFDWTNYVGNLEWLQRRTIVMMRSGSHAYGTNGPSSDLDFKGICIAPREWMLSFIKSEQNFAQADKGWPSGVDCSVYELRNFMDLAAQNNPNIIELLFTDPSDWCGSQWAWMKLYDRRDLFLSRNCKARFSGYAVSQLKRINTHRRWLLSPPTHQPTREEHGLPEFTVIPKDQLDAATSQIHKQVEAWELEWDAIPDEGQRIDFKNRWVDSLAEMSLHADRVHLAAGRKLGFDENFLEHLGKERGYRGAMSEWKQYQNWLRERNPMRAELERKYGYDTKHGMHLVRLMRMAREILTGQGVIVKRPDAEELKAIRFDGAWSFEKLVAWAEAQDAELEGLKASSPLPKEPNRKALAKVCVEILETYDGG